MFLGIKGFLKQSAPNENMLLLHQKLILLATVRSGSLLDWFMKVCYWLEWTDSCSSRVAQWQRDRLLICRLRVQVPSREDGKTVDAFVFSTIRGVPVQSVCVGDKVW
mmetsp:Transcript_38208/g.55811  ORF Transcript_38208/g.55811 Transcript_38208/m.55811 type:complete len:107 (+) Transcript_38208:961-1281(+)